jgi:hypothetical protein
MKHLFSIVAALAILAAPAAAQTIKSIGYNTTNGNIVAATNVVWTNSFSFSTNTVAAQVRSNLSLGLSALTNTNVTNFRTAIGLGLPALTNTSNVTTMRALSGSTNTNHPFTGEILYKEGDSGNSWKINVQNGIILSTEEY